MSVRSRDTATETKAELSRRLTQLCLSQLGTLGRLLNLSGSQWTHLMKGLMTCQQTHAAGHDADVILNVVPATRWTDLCVSVAMAFPVGVRTWLSLRALWSWVRPFAAVWQEWVEEPCLHKAELDRRWA